MLPYRKCHTWELSDKTVGLDIRDETGCCMTAAAFCRISAREAAGSGSASCHYGPLRGPFIPVSAPCEFLAAAAEAGAAAANPAALAVEAGFYGSAEQVGTLFETACAALEPATVGFHTSSAPVGAFRSSAGDGTAAHPAAGVVRGSAAQLSVAVSAADGSRGSHSKRCHPLLRKHRSLDSWFTSAPPASSATRETRSQHDAAASSAGDTPAAVTVTHSTNVVDRDTRVQTFPVVTGTKCGLAAPEGIHAARPAATTVWGAATKTATATGATCTRAGGASAAARAAAAGPESAAGETPETDASAATALTSKNSTILRRPDDGSSGSSCTQKRTVSSSLPDVSLGENRRAVSNTDNCQGEQHDRLPGGGGASRTSQEASPVAEGVAADIGNRADSGVLLPLLQQRRPQLSSRSQSAAACALPAGHVGAPPCSSAAVVLSTQATAHLSGEAATTTALSGATAPALPAAAPALPAAAPALPAAAPASPAAAPASPAAAPALPTAAPALPTAAPALPAAAPALPAAAPALPAAEAAGEGESCTPREAIATAERDRANSVKCVSGPGGVTAADEELGGSSSNDSSSGPPSRTSSFSRRADSAASVGSDGLDLLSDEEQNKLNLFRSIGMMVPVGGSKKGKQHSAKKRSGSSSAPAAYDSFASTCPHSLSFVSSHSFSLPYSSSGGVLRPMEAAANEDWWGSSSEDDGSGISIRIRSRRISELHEIAVKSRVRSATYPTFKIPKEQQQEQQPEEHEPEQQEDGRACRTQSARLSRSARTSTCQSAVNVLQCREQRQQGQKDMRLRQRLQQQEEANQQQYEDCSSTTIERVQDVPPEKRWKVSKPRHSASQQLLCETWYKRILSSGCRSPKFSTTPPPYANVDSSGAEGINSGKHNVAVCGGSVAVAPTVIGKREGLRRTVSLADKDSGLTTSAVLSTALNVHSTIPITAVAAAALLQTEEAAGPAAPGGAALGAASAAALLEGSEATEASEGRAEHGIAGARGDGDMQAALLARAERNLVESPAENVAETLRAAADVPRVHPSVQIPLLSFPRRLDRRERAQSECCSVSSAWEHDTGSGVSCGTAKARDGSQTPLAAADRACSAGEVFFDQSVASSQQFAAATSEAAGLSVLHSSTADRRGEMPAKVNDAALATNEGSDTRTGVDAESANFSGSGTSGGSRSSSSLAPGGFTSAPASGSEIPLIQLFAAKDEGEGRAAAEPGAESRIHQAAGVSGSPATAVTSKESVRVSASLPERRPPSPSISRLEAAATGDEDVSRCASEEGDSTAGVPTTRRMAPGSGLSRRSSGELLGLAEGKGEGFYGGHYSKKTAVAGTTSLMYGRYLGVTDITTGQSTASPSTVSTVSPYSCSGFSSSYSLPSSSTSVLDSQLCASAAATLVSPSPTDTPLEDAFFTASSSPSVAAGLGSSFTPSSAEDSLSFSSCPSPIPSYENRASSPTPPANEAAGEAATESAAVGASTPNASRSAKASVPRSTSFGKHAASTGANHAAAAVTGGRNFPVSAKLTVSGGATAEAGERGGAPDVFGSGARKIAASTRSALWGAPAAGAAVEDLQGVTQCAPPALAGRANNGISEGEPKEGGARQRSAWKVSVRKMFSSKGLLRWKSAVTAVVCKPPGAAHQDVNRDQAAAPEKQEPLPHDAEAAAAHRHLLCHPRGLSPAAFEPVSAPATTSGWSRATGAAAPCRTYTTEKPPREEERPMRTCMEVANKPQRRSEFRTGSSSVVNAEEGIISERFTALSAQRPLVQQQQKRERQVEPHEEIRQELHSGEQQKGRQPHRLSYRCQDEQQQVWQQPQQRIGEQQVGLQQRREDDRREEYVCREWTADKVKDPGSHTQVDDGGGRGDIRAGGGDEAIDRIKEKYVSASSGWLPLSHLREGENLHSGESQHSRGREEETRQQEEKQQLRDRVVVTEHLQTKERTHVGQSPSQVLKHRCRSHVPETEERLPGDAQGQYKIRAELHQQLRLGVQQQERPREVAEICRQDGGYQGRLQTRQEACRRETIEAARDCRDERLHQKVADGERLQQQRRTQPLQQEQLEGTQQWDRARDSDDRRLAEKRVLPDEGGGLTHLVGGPLGGLSVEASKRSEDFFHGTEKCYVPVLSSSWSSPVPLFPPYARSMSSGSSLGHARTLLPSAARSLDWSYCQRPAHHVAAAAATPKEHANAPKHTSAFGRPVAGEAGEAKKHRGAAAAHAVYTTDGTALPALLAIAGPADAARATTTRAAAEAPGAEGSSQLPAVEAAGQLLGRHSTGLTRRVADICAAALPAERNRSGYIDLCLSSTTNDVALPARDTGSPGASFCRVRAPSQAFGGTENASCRGLSESHQDLQQKLLSLEYRGSDRFGTSMEYGAAEHPQQLRRSISLAGTTPSHHPLWRTSRDGDSGVARSETAAAGRSSCSRCATVGMNAEPHMPGSEPESTTGAAVATVSTTAAAGGPAAWTATAESAVYSTLPTAALGQARSSSATTTAPPVEKDMHGAVGEDSGTGGPPAGGSAQCEVLPEVKTLKREKELTALAFIRDHLNTLTPRRRDQRGETRRGERCCVTATDCERSQFGRDEYRAQSSCIPGGGGIRDPPCTVDDDSASVDAAVSPCAHHDTEQADEADVSTTMVETHAIISEHAAAYHLAGPEGPESIFSERDASRFYLSDARRSWPQIAVAGFSILKGSGATAETQQPVETPCATPASGQQATPQTSGRRETTLEHHIRRFLQLWADGEQVPGNSSSDSLRLGTGSGPGSRRTEEQQQQQNRVADRGEVADEERDTTAQRTPQREGAGAASQASLVRQCPSEERSAAGGTSSCGPCLLSDLDVARSRPAVGSWMCSGGNSEGSSHPSVSAHTGARNEVGARLQEAQLIRRYKSENATGPLATRLRLRKCTGGTTEDVSVAGETSARRLCRAGSAPAAEVLTTRSDAAAIFPAKFRTSTGCSSAVTISVLPSAAIPDCSSAAAHASGFACGAGNAAAGFPRSADHAVCGSHFLSGSNPVCRGWSLDVSADSPHAAPEMVGTFVSTGGTSMGQSGQTATRRSRTAASLSAAAAKCAFDQPTANASRALRAAEAEITGRVKEASALSRAGLSDSVSETAAGEDGVTETSIQRSSRDSHGCRLVMQPQRLEKDELHQREQLPGANLHKSGRQTNQKVPEETEAQQPWCQHAEQQLPRQRQDAAAPAENVVFSVEQVVFKEGAGQPQEETDVRDGDAHESGVASTFGAAGLQPFLMFPTKAEECYRQKLDSVFSFRLLIVGAALLLVQVLHLLWGAVRRGFLWGSSHEEDTWCRIAAVGDAVQLALYVVLSLGGHIHTSRFSLETWTCGLFSLAFATRCCTLLATLFLGQGASALSFAAGDVPAAATAAQLASYSGAVSYQLVRLSLCCIFHVLLSGMMLPARTLVCLPMHAFHFGGCLIAAGAAATYTRLDLNPDGPLCALSSCLYTVLGCFCQAQLEASQRQLYVQWKNSQRGLQDMQRKRGQRSPSSGGVTGVEQVALLVRQSQVLLRDAVGGNSVHSREGIFEQLASLQKEILEIVTGVRSIYHAQTGKEEIYELLHSVPEGHDVEPPAVGRRIREQGDSQPCRQAASNGRGCWLCPQSEPLLVKRPAESRPRGTAQAPWPRTGEAPDRVAGAAAPGGDALDAAAPQEKVVSAPGTNVEGKRLPTITRRAEASVTDIFRDSPLETAGGRTGDWMSCCRPRRSTGSVCPHRSLFEADLEDGSVLRETVEKLQKAASDKAGGAILQEPSNGAIDLICRLGIEWDVDFFQVDEYTEGNTLRLTGEVQLSPLVRPDGLRCELRVLRRFLHSVQRQYRVTNPYHNQLHAAMVSHCCLVLVGECLPSRDALTYTDEICLCVAALTHDMGHPGLTNQYLISSQSLLATTYNDIAVLENYHAACCFRTAGHCEDLNIFAGLSQEVYSYMRQNIIGLILATDMSKHLSYISRLRVRLEAGNFNPAIGADRWLFFQACVKAADLAHLATNWEQHRRWAELLCEEFYRQGDEERRQGLPVIETFDRNMSHRFPQSQFRFIQVVVMPLIEALVDVETLLKGRGGVRTIICRHIVSNRRKWKKLAVAAGFACPAGRDGDAAGEDEEDSDEQQTTGEQSRTREECGVCKTGER